MKELLKAKYEKARSDYRNFLCDEFDMEIKKLKYIIKCTDEESDVDLDYAFGDFHITLNTDNSYSDYYNLVTFLTIVDGKVVVGRGVFDSGDYDYNYYESDYLPSDMNKLEYVLDELRKEVNHYKKNIVDKF